MKQKNFKKKSDVSVAGIVLAAGKGTRMKSAKPKVLHEVAGFPMLELVLEKLKKAGVEKSVVVVPAEHQAFDVVLKKYQSAAVIQNIQQGTADAVGVAGLCLQSVNPPAYAQGSVVHGELSGITHVLICAGDTPALNEVELADFMEQCQSAKVSLGLIGFSPPSNYGYGRLVSKKQPWLDKIVEEKDATAREKKITLCNSGVIFAEVHTLFRLLSTVKPQNAQKEYYLTSIFEEAKKKKIKALIYEAKNYQSFQGINDRWQLSTMESYLVEQHIESLAKSGVSFHLPLTSFIDLSVQIGVNTVIGSHVVFQQNTAIGEGCVVSERTTLKNVKVGQGAIIGANCYLAGCNIKDREEVPAGTIRTDR